MFTMRHDAHPAVRSAFQRPTPAWAPSMAAPLCMVALLCMVGPRPAAARTHGYRAEIIPSVGLTRSVDGDEAKPYVSLALRGPVVPGFLETEFGVAYRHDTFSNGQLTEHSWPITASL